MGRHSEKIPKEIFTENFPDHKDEKVVEEACKENPPEKEYDLERYEISINYAKNGKLWDKSEIEDISGIFSFYIAEEINQDDPNPTSVLECQESPDCGKWKIVMRDELVSLDKRNVFGPIVVAPKGVIPIRCKWVFVRKRNEKKRDHKI